MKIVITTYMVWLLVPPILSIDGFYLSEEGLPLQITL